MCSNLKTGLELSPNLSGSVRVMGGSSLMSLLTDSYERPSKHRRQELLTTAKYTDKCG